MKTINSKLFLVLLLCVLQQMAYTQVSIGFKYAASNVRFDDLKGRGAAVGAAFEWQFTKVLTLESGIIAASRNVGGRTSGGPDFFDDEAEVNLTRQDKWHTNYLYIPAALKINIPLKKPTTFAFFKFGAYYGQFLNGKFEDGIFGELPVTFNDNERGGIVGAGIQLNLKRIHLVIEMEDRFNFGDLTEPDDRHKLRLNTFEMTSLKVLIPLRKQENH